MKIVLDENIPQNAAIIVKNGQFTMLVNHYGRAMVVNSSEYFVQRFAMNAKFKVVNTTSQIGQRIFNLFKAEKPALARKPGKVVREVITANGRMEVCLTSNKEVAVS